MQIADILIIAKRLQVVARAAAIPQDIIPPLTGGEMSVLDFLVYQEKPVSISDIVAHVQMAQSRVSTVVQALQKRRWVHVHTDVADRRSTKVKLKSEVARGARSVLCQSAAAALNSILVGAKGKDRRAIVKGLDLLAETLRDASG